MKTKYKEKLDALRFEVLDLIDQGDYMDFGFANRHTLKARSEVFNWARETAEKIIQKIDGDESIKPSYLGDRRTLCPLCKRGPNSPYIHAEGFSIPEGLRRHLLGSYNAHQCFFIKVAIDTAIDEINE